MISHPVYYHGIIIAVFLSQAFAYTICNNTYTNGIGIQCFPCEPGYTAIEDCPGNYTSTKCEQCQDGTYQPECVTYNETVSCRNCTVCNVYKENCTIYKDAVCELKNGDSSDDSGDLLTRIVYWLIGFVLVFLVVVLVVYKINIYRKSKCKVDNEWSSNYSQEKQDDGNGYDKEKVIRRILQLRTWESVLETGDSENTQDPREVENTNDILQHRIRESAQVIGDTKNTLDQTTGYNTMYIIPGEENMLDVTNLTDQHSKYKADDDSETTLVEPKQTEKQTAVVHPYDETKINGRKEVGHIDDRLQHITKESLQVTGDYENTEARGSEFKIKENQLCHRSGDQSLSSMDLDKGTSELQINWIKVFLQLSRSFPASKWKLFAIDLLTNCQQMAKSVHDTVDEIELEVKNQHTESCFIHAYIKVFNKWLDNLGRTNATFEHIKDAVSATIEAKEALELVLSIERKPPLKVTTPMPLVPYNLNQTFGNNSTHSQQYMALHDDEVPGNSNYARDVYVRSRQQTHRVQVAHCSYCSRYTTNEVSNLQETSVQLNKTSVETNCNNNDKNTVKRERNKKRKKDQSKSKPQQHKRSTTEQYMIDNAKENLLLDSIPIRQNDYKMFMNFVLDLVSNECNVGKETVLSITHEEFCEAQEINTKENDTFFLVKTGKTNLFIGKEVYEDLAVYGNIARPKLLTYLKAKNIDYDSTASERFLFITFNGKPLMENKDDKNVSNIDAKEKATEQNIQVNRKNDPFVRVCPDMKESEEHVNITTTLKQNPSDHLCDYEQSINGIGKNNTSIEDEFYPGAAITEHDKKELDNKAGCGQDTIRIKEKENKKEETNYFDLDIEKELEKIKESFFPTGDESYALPDADNVAEVLSKFVDKDLYNSP